MIAPKCIDQLFLIHVVVHVQPALWLENINHSQQQVGHPQGDCQRAGVHARSRDRPSGFEARECAGQA